MNFTDFVPFLVKMRKKRSFAPINLHFFRVRKLNVEANAEKRVLRRSMCYSWFGYTYTHTHFGYTRLFHTQIPIHIPLPTFLRYPYPYPYLPYPKMGMKLSGCPKSLFVFLKTMFLCVGMELRHE